MQSDLPQRATALRELQALLMPLRFMYVTSEFKNNV